MLVEIHESALKWLKAKGKTTLCLSVLVSGGGCCPPIETYDISYAAPDLPDAYHRSSQEGIAIYVEKTVKVLTHKLIFKLEKGFFSSTIIAQGLKRTQG